MSLVVLVAMGKRTLTGCLVCLKAGRFQAFNKAAHAVL
ncbi:hypothetical protein PLUA15_40133 [Pseudomonas lundensis]|uniref:Uncharacterized protein n=1 Tax=Pseudomonas lundensis TaxID=86185 RepID=A0AAX2HAY3_9PSED|nr:hypothetical protein PLUA15_40133 [Pseudomonas lundensis]